MNTRCREIRSLFDRLLDGELGEGERERLETHLRECPACSALLKGERETVGMLASLPVLKCPEELDRRVREVTLKRERRPIRFLVELLSVKNFGWKIAAVGAAAATVIVFLLNPFIPENGPVEEMYTREDVGAARTQAKWSLVYVASILNDKERKVIKNVVVKDFSQTVRNCIRKQIR